MNVVANKVIVCEPFENHNQAEVESFIDQIHRMFNFNVTKGDILSLHNEQKYGRRELKSLNHSARKNYILTCSKT